MKILLVTGIFPPDIGGPATYTEELAGELKKRGFEVAVFCYADRPEAGRFYDFPVVRVSRAGGVLRRYGRFFWQMWKIGGNYDLLFAQGADTAALPTALVSLLVRRKMINKVVGDYSWEYARNNQLTEEGIDDFQKRTSYSWQAALIRGIQKFVCWRSSRVVVPSNYLKRMVEGWGVRGEKIEVIYNAVEPVVVEESREELRRLLGWEGKKVLISVGRMTPWKGFDVLVELMPELLNKAPELRLVLVGDGPLEKKLRTMIKERGLEAIVELKGRLSRQEVGRCLKAADLFVLYTGYEGLSHVLLEAMASGVPVVVSNCGGNNEVVEDGVNGWLVAYGDRERLREILGKALADDRMAELMKEGARRRLEQFSYPAHIERVIDFLNLIGYDGDHEKSTK